MSSTIPSKPNTKTPNHQRQLLFRVNNGSLFLTITITIEIHIWNTSDRVTKRGTWRSMLLLLMETLLTVMVVVDIGVVRVTTTDFSRPPSTVLGRTTLVAFFFFLTSFLAARTSLSSRRIGDASVAAVAGLVRPSCDKLRVTWPDDDWVSC